MEPIYPPKLTQSNPTQPTGLGLFFGVGGLGWVGLGWVANKFIYLFFIYNGFSVGQQIHKSV